jgi:hypothetical protein
MYIKTDSKMETEPYEMVVDGVPIDFISMTANQAP